MKPDFDFTDHGSIVLVRPTTEAAREHLVDHTDGQWLGDALAVEPRFAPDLSLMLVKDGYVVELPDGRVVSEEDIRADLR